MCRDSKEILADLKKYKESIILILTRRCWEHFHGYFFIKLNTPKLLSGSQHQKLARDFSWFYDISGRFGLSEAQNKKFFELLAVKETSLEKILRELYNALPPKLHLVFATKLLHTIDNKSPIYDSHIRDVLGLREPVYQGLINNRIKKKLEVYTQLNRCFSDLKSEKEAQDFLNDLRSEFKNRAKRENFAWQDNLICDEKLLDSALWALYSAKNGKKGKSG